MTLRAHCVRTLLQFSGGRPLMPPGFVGFIDTVVDKPVFRLRSA
ncbi:hypothetical protein [Hyphomicrobium methylovorum]|nr:hypothetical protein [Hyphomicrobium methylovorum]